MSFSSHLGRHAKKRTDLLARVFRKNARLWCRSLEDRLAPATLFGVSGTNDLIQFSDTTPGTIIHSAPITGLQSGETILDIDVRPLGQQILALGSTNRLYSINVATGTATQIGAAGAFTLTGTVGMDVNPVTDQIAVVSTLDQNLLINAATGALITTNPVLNYNVGDAHFGANPNLAAVAFTNSFPGATSTSEFGIDTNLDTLVLVNGTTGKLTTVGNLGLNVTEVSGFEIAANGNTGLAVFTTNGTSSGLYSINLTTGQATLVGNIGSSATLVRGLAAAPTTVDATSNVFGITDANALIGFNTGTPGTTTSNIAITGLQTGETILGLDVIPGTQQVVALGSTSRIYSINTTTGVATPIGSAGAFTLSGTNFGFSVDPVTGQIRIVSNLDQNIQVNPTTGALTATNTTLAFAAGDVNFGANPNIVATAFMNAVPGATSTTLFGIDSNLDALVTIDGATGAVRTVGPLGINVTDAAGFDISANGTTGIAALTVNGTSSGLYSINLTTGQATLIGNVGSTATLLRGLTVAPTPSGTGGITSTLSGSTATITGTSGADSIVFDTSGGLLRHNLFTAGNTGFVSDLDFDSTMAGEQTLAADGKATVIVNAGTGNDTVNIGTTGAAAATVAAQFTINGQGGTDVLNIQDSSDTTGRTINISDTQVAIGTSPTVKFSETETLNVFAGTGVDKVTVESTAAGVSTTVDLSAGGADEVRVGTSFSGGTNTLNNIKGALNLIGNSAANKLFVDDSDSSKNGTTVFMISGSEVRRVGDPSITFSQFELIDVTGGTSRDQFHIKPDADAEISVHGGLPDPTSNSGDRVLINRGGTTGAKLTSTETSTGFEGTWTFTNRKTVTFEGIEKLTPASQLVVGADKGGGPHIRIFDPTTGKEKFGKFAFDPSFRGGVRVAVGDVNGDGVGDIIAAAGNGGGPHVKIFDGDDGTLIREFFAFDANFHGGLFVASGDVNGDGFDDVIVAAGESGGPHVKVFSGADGTLLREFFAFDAGFRGGVRVASGDVNSDGFDDIIVSAGVGGGPHVKVFSGADGTLIEQFFAFDAGFRGGVFVSAVDADNDGDDDIVTSAGEGGGPHVIIRNGQSLAVMKSFFAFDAGFRGGVRVGAADVNNDGVVDLVVSSGQGNQSPHFLAFNLDDLSQLEDEFAFDKSFNGGVFVGGI